jgi:tRNA threonylcarbamoyladenosine biosynthesis protein TsaE
MLTLFATNLESSQAIATELAKVLLPGSILWLSGNLGSGKTTFVQGLGKGLGIEDQITSPTFSLIDEHLQGRIPLYHIDLYRLEPEEVGSLHLFAYWQGIDFELGIVAIEWAERMIPQLPPYLKISLTPLIDQGIDQAEEKRKIEFIASENSGDQYRSAIAHLGNCFSHLSAK